MRICLITQANSTLNADAALSIGINRIEDSLSISADNVVAYKIMEVISMLFICVSEVDMVDLFKL